MANFILRNGLNKMKDYLVNENPDFIHRKEIEEAIKLNGGYCCCALEKTDDTRCMCKEFREQNHYGFCHCGRYYKVRKCKTVCLCGSTKFKDTFFEVAREFTRQGYIVTMPAVFAHCGDPITDEEKIMLDEIHKTKIHEADLVFIINKDGYIGESTHEEIEWAEMLHKKIEYLEK